MLLAIIAGLFVGLVMTFGLLSLWDALGYTCDNLKDDELEKCNETLDHAWSAASTIGVVSGFGVWFTVLKLFNRN
jgi:hypothetical protein